MNRLVLALLVVVTAFAATIRSTEPATSFVAEHSGGVVVNPAPPPPPRG